jgi:hypothetical protein
LSGAHLLLFVGQLINSSRLTATLLSSAMNWKIELVVSHSF